MSNEIEFPPVNSSDLADYLCFIADSSQRPQSVVNTFVCALKQLFLSQSIHDITKDIHIVRLISAIVKSQTKKPMKRSTVLPVGKITSMFLEWGENKNLSLKFLRIKAITLLALALMLRPSDIAPKATIFEVESECEKSIEFTKDMLDFTNEGVHVTLFGIKNDAERKGFNVFLPKNNTNSMLDPVETLKYYIERTEDVRSDNGVFLAIKSPYKALTAAAVAKVLQDCLNLAGLSHQRFSAKSFRPT